MARLLALFGLLIFSTAILPAQRAEAQAQDEKRIALVIGNAAYKTGALATSANDAGLIAQTLQAAGFDVSGARDLDQDSLRHAFRDFLDKASSSGPNTVAFVYLAGYGVQLEGENYFVPVDADIATPAAVSAEAIRISDFTRPLGALPLKASIVVIDGARVNELARSDQPLAGGLALVDAEPKSLIAFNAAPGTVAPAEQGPYGVYAQSLAEMMRSGGLPIADVFDRTRLRVSEKTNGGVLPWNASRLTDPFVFFDRAPDAPAPEAAYDEDKTMQSKPIADFDAGDAYAAALARDTLPAYQDFLTAYPRDPMAKRVRAIVAARREAITWQQTWRRDTPNAYWSYLRRYPRGPHAWDARRRLEYLSAALEPPPTFDMIEYDVPPPPEYEIVYVDRPVIIFSDPYYDLPPPPPPPIFFLRPPPPDFVVLAPPPPPIGPYMLPSPHYVAVPQWVRPPRYVEPPPENFIYNNLHNGSIVNETLSARPQPGELTTGEKAAGAAIAIGAGAAAARVALPPFLRKRAGVPPQPGQPGFGGAQILPGTLQKPGRLPPAQTLPGMNGQALPLDNGKPPLPGQLLPGAKPGKLGPGGKPLPGAQPGGLLPGQVQTDQMQPGQLQPGRKGQGRLRPLGKPLPGATPLPGEQALPNAQTGDQPLPGTGGAQQQGQGKKGQGRLRPLGKQQPGATPLPGGQALPNAQTEGQPLPGVGGAQQQGQGRKRLPGKQPDAGAGPGQQLLPGEQALPRGRKPRLQGGQPNNAPADDAQPQPRQKRLNQAPALDATPQMNGQPRNRQQGGPKPQMQFQPPDGGQAPRQQMRQQQQQQQQQPQRLRPPPQEGAPPAGQQRRCGRPGLPPCNN